MFNANRYSIRWQFFSLRNKYRIYEDGELVLRLEYEQGGLPGGVRLVDTDGETAYRIRTDRVIVEPSFSIVDERTGESVGSVRREVVSRSRRRWKLVDGDGSVVAHIHRRTTVPGPLRRLLSGFVLFVPPAYDVRTPDGKRLGAIGGRFKLRDTEISAEKQRLITLPGMDAGYTYTVDLSADADAVVDPRLAVLGTIAIDVADAAGTTR